jgi:hypothetical protein
MVNEQQLATPEELAWLEKMSKLNGYLAPTPMGNGRYAVLHPFIFTMAIITGDMFDDAGYDDRWCYDSATTAAAALAIWMVKGFEGEPQGWHRHPGSGRRRPEGNQEREYVNP